MPRPQKLLELASQSEANGSHNDVSASSTAQPKTRLSTIFFGGSIKSSFRKWLKERKNRELFDSAKRIRYRWFLENPNSEINETKVEGAVKFNERYDALNYFVLKDNELYLRAFNVAQPERCVVCDYSAVKIIEKVYAQLEHSGNLKTFAKIKQFYYGIKKEMVEWLLKRYAVCLNHRQSNTRAFLQPNIALEVMEQVQIDLVDIRSQRDGYMKCILHIKDNFSK